MKKAILILTLAISNHAFAISSAARTQLKNDFHVDPEDEDAFKAFLKEGNVKAFTLFLEAHDDIPFRKSIHVEWLITATIHEHSSLDMFKALLPYLSKGEINYVFQKSIDFGSYPRCYTEFTRSAVKAGGRIQARGGFLNLTSDLSDDKCPEAETRILMKGIESSCPETVALLAKEYPGCVPEFYEHYSRRLPVQYTEEWAENFAANTESIGKELRSFVSTQCEDGNLRACRAQKSGALKEAEYNKLKSDDLALAKKAAEDEATEKAEREAGRKYQQSPEYLLSEICQYRSRLEFQKASIAHQRKIANEVGVVDKSELYKAGSGKVMLQDLIVELSGKYKAKTGKNPPAVCPGDKK